MTDTAGANAGRTLNELGVAFPHDDGEGFNVILQALPLHGNGKIMLRAYDPEKHQADEAVVQVNS